MAVISIVGRPNVGKSSLFNRFLGERHAIVDDVPGITRDRLYAEVVYKDTSFYVVDTGGILGEQNKDYDFQIKEQTTIAIEESDLVLFMVDARSGLLPTDHDIALLVRKSGKPVILVINKVDGENPSVEGAFASLGFDVILPVSAVHNRNISQLLEMIHIHISREKDLLPEEQKPVHYDLSVAFVGRPNVGKSSLFNHYSGSERSLVSDVPGTTRDSIDFVLDTPSGAIRFIDTAGLRKRSKISSSVEYYSMVRSYNAIDRCDVAVLVMDGQEPATDREKKICAHVAEKGKALVFAVNKWDLAPRDPKLGDHLRKYMKKAFVFFNHAPVLFISAKTGRHLKDLPEVLFQVYRNWCYRMPTALLNTLLRELMAFERMPSDGQGRFLKLFYCTQVSVSPPMFVFVVNDTKIVTKQFSRYVEKKLRSLADYSGVPLRLKWKNRSE